MQNNINNMQQQPVATVNKKAKKKTGIKIAVAVISMILVAVITVTIGVSAIIFISYNKKGDSEKIGLYHDMGMYSSAYDKYEKLYGVGNYDEELLEVLNGEINGIIDDYKEEKLNVEKTNELIDVLEDMDIDVITTKIIMLRPIIASYPNGQLASLLNLFDGTNESDASVEEKHDADADEDYEDAYVTEAPTEAPQVETTKDVLITEPVEDPVSSEPVIESASTLVGTVLATSNVNSNRSFEAGKAIDGYYDSCWCVNTDSSGAAGARIRFNLEEESYVKGIKIINGNLYQPEKDIYSLNGQLKTFTLTFSDGTSEVLTADYCNGEDVGYQYFDFDEAVCTEFIILTVDSAYVGTKYTTNVCLGEFNVY